MPYKIDSRLPFDVCSILTHIFFWLNNGKSADPCITKLSILSSTRKCDDDPEGTLFS